MRSELEPLPTDIEVAVRWSANNQCVRPNLLQHLIEARINAGHPELLGNVFSRRGIRVTNTNDLNIRRGLACRQVDAIRDATGPDNSNPGAHQGRFARLNAFQPQVVAHVVEANILDHPADQRIVIGNLAVLNIASQQVAEYTSEIFMTRVRRKRS